VGRLTNRCSGRVTIKCTRPTIIVVSSSAILRCKYGVPPLSSVVRHHLIPRSPHSGCPPESNHERSVPIDVAGNSFAPALAGFWFRVLNTTMTFDVYGRFRIEVVRAGEEWVAYRLELGKRSRMRDVVIPASLQQSEIAVYLDDLYHESATPGQAVREI
jgi:hypothetical protein